MRLIEDLGEKPNSIPAGTEGTVVEVMLETMGSGLV